MCSLLAIINKRTLLRENFHRVEGRKSLERTGEMRGGNEQRQAVKAGKVSRGLPQSGGKEATLKSSSSNSELCKFAEIPATRPILIQVGSQLKKGPAC